MVIDVASTSAILGVVLPVVVPLSPAAYILICALTTPVGNAVANVSVTSELDEIGEVPCFMIRPLGNVTLSPPTCVVGEYPSGYTEESQAVPLKIQNLPSDSSKMSPWFGDVGKLIAMFILISSSRSR